MSKTRLTMKNEKLKTPDGENEKNKKIRMLLLMSWQINYETYL